ncbi:MAG: UV DNA damage repair endonuclease UvsE [Thermomicrobiales bacterium]
MMTGFAHSGLPGPNRLGFAVKILGRPNLKSDDARRWQSGPHLSVSLGYLEAIFDYLGEAGIRMYRISSNLAPYATHPDLAQFHGQIDECREELARVGAKAQDLDIRLSFHPGQYTVLNSPRTDVVEAAARDVIYQADLLDALGCGPEARVVLHVGGVYGDRAAAIDRFVARYLDLPEHAQRRLVVENDETSYSVVDTLEIHERTGVSLVWDILHHRLNNPAQMGDTEACRLCLATWPAGEVPKIHFSSPRVGAIAEDPGDDTRSVGRKPGSPRQHGDWIDGADFIAFMDAMEGAEFDAMLEAKQKDLALLRLREEIASAGLRARIW